MTQMMHGVTKGGKAVPIRVDEQGRVVVVIEKPENIVQRVIKRVRKQSG